MPGGLDTRKEWRFLRLTWAGLPCTRKKFRLQHTWPLKAFELCHLLGEREVLAECLEILAIAALKEGDAGRGTRLTDAAQALWEILHVAHPPTHHSPASLAGAVAAMRFQLSEGVYASTWQAGRAMSLDSVVAFALDCGADG